MFKTPSQYQEEINKLLPQQEKIEKQITTELLKNITKSLRSYIKIEDLSRLDEYSSFFELFFLDKISINICSDEDDPNKYNYPVNVKSLDQNLYKEYLRLRKKINNLIEKRDNPKIIRYV